VADDLDDKLRALRRRLQELDRPVVAFSGGADSSFLAVVTYQVLGDRIDAAIADSPSLPRRELDDAMRFAERHGFPVHLIRTTELDDPRYRQNAADRCGYCKNALLNAVISHPLLTGRPILLGVNTDDLGDHRPGQHAAQIGGARFPLVEVGLSKNEIRQLSRRLGLETWNKPAAACLASRIAYGVPVTPQGLARVEEAEESLRAIGVTGDLRVRDQGSDLARIEVPAEQLEHVLARRSDVVRALRQAGFRYVTLDLEGFRSGSHNLVLVPLGACAPTSSDEGAE
jgi:uncharacterized protein